MNRSGRFGPNHRRVTIRDRRRFVRCPPVDILKIGRSRVIVPQGKRWDDLFLAGPRASEDFLSERNQPAAEEREAF